MDSHAPCVHFMTGSCSWTVYTFISEVVVCIQGFSDIRINAVVNLAEWSFEVEIIG